jgi:hypothetical protein
VEAYFPTPTVVDGMFDVRFRQKFPAIDRFGAESYSSRPVF